MVRIFPFVVAIVEPVFQTLIVFVIQHSFGLVVARVEVEASLLELHECPDQSRMRLVMQCPDSLHLLQ